MPVGSVREFSASRSKKGCGFGVLRAVSRFRPKRDGWDVNFEFRALGL